MSRDSNAVVVAATFVFCTILLIPGLALACGKFTPGGAIEELLDTQGEGADALVHDAEKMLYVDRGDGRWTVYQSRSFDADDAVEEFAWLLPVPGQPQVELAPSMLFERLVEATEPNFELEDVSDGDCPAEPRTFLEETQIGLLSADDPETLDQFGQADEDASVRAVDAGNIGPYDHVTIETRDDVDDPGQRAVEWLESNDYHVESGHIDLLGEYLAEGKNLLAMRLSADAAAEEIQPVAITAELDRAASPMRLAQAGADDEVDILVWTAGEGRAMPDGWPRVEINEGLVDWTAGGDNYRQVVAEAVQEAGGRGFVTDYAMPTGDIDGQLWSERHRDRWENVKNRSDYTQRPRQTLRELSELFGGEQLLESILRDEIPLPSSSILADQIHAGPSPSAIIDHFRGQDSPPEDIGDSDDSPDAEHPGADQRQFHQALDDAEFIAPCFASELEQNRRAGGPWSATIHAFSEHDELLEEIDSQLSEDFDDCVAEGLERHLEETNYDPGVFPAEVRIGLTNPWEFQHGDTGFPALQSPQNDRLEEVDWPRVVERADEQIAAPLEDARHRITANNRLTRLSTVVEPEDLTEDVSFFHLPGHDDVPATREATRTIECNEDEADEHTEIDGRRRYEVRDWSVEFDRGDPVHGRGVGDWPAKLEEHDAAELIVEYDESDRMVDEYGESGEREESGEDEVERDTALSWWLHLLLGLGLTALAVGVFTALRDDS